MAVKTEKDLPESHKASWFKAMSAVQLKNYGYAITLLQGVLKDNPEFLDGRTLLRRAEISKFGNKKGILGLSGGSFSAMKAQSGVKKDPVAAIADIEKLLETDPFNASANNLLKEAAMLAKMPELASFALETIVEGNPKDTKTMHELAKHYMQIALPFKAVALYEKISAINPQDLAAIKGGKDAAAASSMQRGGWEREETTYRDLIHNKEQAVSLEQQGRVVLSAEMIDQQLVEMHEKFEANPESVDFARRIAELYEQKEDLENAIEWYRWSAHMTHNSDHALVRKGADLQIKQYDNAIRAREEYVATYPDAEDSRVYADEIAQYKMARATLQLDEARKRVERNPTDLVHRFELGEILVAAGQFQDAIQELQQARRNPNVRLKAMSLLAQCFSARSMYDLAAKTFAEAASEIPAMDATKKSIVYNLGLVYEKMGQMDKSIECMKQIYEVDYGYMDVAPRVENSYSAA